MMNTSTLSLLCCPECHGELTFDGALHCTRCSSIYPVQDGVPHFIAGQELTGQNRRFAYLYDWFSYIYRPYAKIVFAFIGGEDRNRNEIVNRMELGSRVLEVSIGPGNNLPYLLNHPEVKEIFGVDISPGQIKQCKAFSRRRGYPVELFLGEAEQLPFKDETFDTVFHVGGINFFSDKKKAIEEMVRVAKPGTKIVIVDENERGAKFYDWTLPGFSRSFKDKRPRITAPVDCVPAGMLDVQVLPAWRGWFYCLEFRKPGSD